MRAFFRDNIAVVVGISLPIVVMTFFVVASRLPRSFVEPPQHDLLLLSQNGRYDSRPVRIDIRIDAGTVRTRMYKSDSASNPAALTMATPRLFRWSHDTQSVHEIVLILPDDINAIQNGDGLVIDELVGRSVSTDMRAPDGYSFQVGGYDRGFFGVFFDGGAREPVISKRGATIPLAVPGEAGYWNVQFLAWVVE